MKKVRRWFPHAVAIFLGGGLIAILKSYADYFPVNFDDGQFLSGRRYTFVGWYPLAFFTHLVSAPVVLVLATLLWCERVSRSNYRTTHQRVGVRPEFGGRRCCSHPLTDRRHHWHRRLGITQALLTLGFMVPSGLWMAQSAYGGLAARLAFSAQSILTAMLTIAVTRSACRRNHRAHRRWADRLMIVLGSPIIFRMLASLGHHGGFETETWYAWNAWISWLLPWLVYEAFLWRPLITSMHRSQAKEDPATPEEPPAGIETRTPPFSIRWVGSSTRLGLGLIGTLVITGCERSWNESSTIRWEKAEFQSADDYRDYDNERRSQNETGTTWE